MDFFSRYKYLVYKNYRLNISFKFIRYSNHTQTDYDFILFGLISAVTNS